MKVNNCICVSVFVIISRLYLVDSLCTQSRITILRAKQSDALPTLSRSDISCIRSRESKSLELASSINRCDEYAEVLSKPRWGGAILGPIVRYLNTIMIGSIFSIILRVFNKFTAVRRELLVDKIFNREPGRGLLTVSNHQSMADDPGLFSAMIPWWRITSKQMRWVLCTEDIFFFVSYYSTSALNFSGSLPNY